MAAMSAVFPLILATQAASQALWGPGADPTIEARGMAAKATLCTDNSVFVDEMGYTCQDWAGYNCSEEVFSRYGYSNAGAAAVLKYCKSTCGRCRCMDNFMFVDEQGYTCREWTDWLDSKGYTCTADVFSRYGYSNAGAAAVLEYCKPTCGRCRCTDNFMFVDEHGYTCREWTDWLDLKGYTCTADVFSRYSYSNAGAAAVLAFCKYTCGRCSSYKDVANTAPILDGQSADKHVIAEPVATVSTLCADNSMFVDEKGYTCGDWAGHTCTADVLGEHGYSTAGAAAVLASCKYTCGWCASVTKAFDPTPAESNVLLP